MKAENTRLLGFRAGVCSGGIPYAYIDDPEYKAGYADGERAIAEYQEQLRIESEPPSAA